MVSDEYLHFYKDESLSFQSALRFAVVSDESAVVESLSGGSFNPL